MPAVQFVVEGGRTLNGSIRPSGNKNAALPIVAAALLSENPVHLENVPRIRDIETLVELIRSLGVTPMIGACGRRWAMRRAVAPLCVKATIALIGSERTIAAAASPIALGTEPTEGMAWRAASLSP